MADQSTRRRFLAASGALGVAALAGCTGAGGGGDPTETAMDDAMTDEMTETMADDGMTETAMDDGMTDTMTEGGMGDEMTQTMTEDGMMGTEFTVRVENVSTTETLQTMDGSVAVPLAPVAYALHDEMGALFRTGEPASEGLETLAEDGSPTTLVEELEAAGLHAGAAAVPVDADEAGPIGPGGTYEFTVTAHEGQYLSLATMFVQSNDLFYAPEPAGIPLWADGEPVDGDLTDRLVLWDAGTEVNEEPGAGSNQPPRQSGPDTGPSEDGVVRRISAVDDGFTYPDVSDVVNLTVSPGGMG